MLRHRREERTDCVSRPTGGSHAPNAELEPGCVDGARRTLAHAVIAGLQTMEVDRGSLGRED